MDDKDCEFLMLVAEAAGNMRRGEEKTIQCSCGGNILIIKSSYNGHVWAKCDNCDQYIIS